MRVLVVSNTYPPADISGVGALVYELARQLARAGHRPRVLTRVAPAADPHAVGVAGPKALFPLLAGWRSLRLALVEPYDLVHVHESDGAFVVLLQRLLGLLPGRSRPPIVSTLQVSYRRERHMVRALWAADARGALRTLSRPTRDERVFRWLRAPIHAVLGRLTARLSDAVVAPSKVTREELREDYGARQVEVIYNGLALETVPRRADPDPASEDAAAEVPTILYAGRLRTRKAVAVLLEAMARLHSDGRSVRLVIAGGGEQLPALRRQARRLGLGAAVRFLGKVPRAELLPWYAEASVYCLPSLYEGFPVAILEAMAAGLPVVTTRVSGNPEAVEHEKTGLLVDPLDVSGLAEALVRLLDDPAWARRLGNAGRRRIEAEFSIERIADDYLRLWQNLASDPGGRQITATHRGESASLSTRRDTR